MSEMNGSINEEHQQSSTGNGSEVVDTLQERAEVARSEMSTVADEAKHEVRSFADEAKHQVRQRAEEQGEQIGAAVREFGDDLQAMANNVDDPERPAARAVVQVGQRVTEMADQMQRQGMGGLLDDLTNYARQHPGQFVAGAVAAGFVVGRVVRNVDKAAITDQMKGNHQDASAFPGGSESGQPTIDLTDDPHRQLSESGTGAGRPAPSGADPTRVGPSVAGIGGEEVGAW